MYKYKAIIEASILSTPEDITDNTPLTVVASGMLKPLSTRNLIIQVSTLLDETKKLLYSYWELQK